MGTDGDTRDELAKSIFLDALEIASPRDRLAYVDHRCGSDDRLRAEVETLLRHQGQLGDYLERPALDSDATRDLTPRPLTEGPGTIIGPYKLLEQIGEGGMGVVYMAEQTRPVRRKVALKIIKPGMDTRQVIARFEAERQALALMDHPNIARVLDAGATASARPYFVMELVKGIPITDYCDRNRLAIDDRLELFVQVCQAVQHAHQKGIIHRDLKPSNVLVTMIDGAAVPKIIDFGVAKAMGQQLTEKTLFTGFAQLIGTPLYMSPEQAEFSGVDVDTRSDIYALGVLLYELLTGTTPFSAQTFCTVAYDEIRRIIREVEPPRPSTRISTLEATAPTVSANRRSDPRALSKLVRGELDWIVMKAMEKDRNRRYETANDFAADVMRYLTDRPVEACPPTAGYRFSKYARRHRTALTTAALVGLTLVAGTAVSIWEAWRATRAETQAERRAEETQLVVDYLINDVFGAAAPEKARGRTVTVHDLLAAGEELIPARFGSSPRVEAASREALGRAYEDLGRYDQAARQFRRVAELRARLLGPDHPDTAAAESLLVRALCPPVSRPSQADEAESVARRVLEVRRRTLGPEHPRTLASMTALAGVLRVKHHMVMEAEMVSDRSGKLLKGRLFNEMMRARGPAAMREPQGLLERSYAGQARLLGPSHAEALETLNTLGLVLWSKGDFDGSEATLRRVSEVRSRVLGPAHPDTLRSRKLLGVALRRQGRLDEAIRLFLEVAEGDRQTFGPVHIETSSAISYLFDTLRWANRGAAMRDFCQRWLREILASPLEADPFLRERRGIRLAGLALQLVMLPEPVPFEAELAVQAVREAAALDGKSSRWSVLGVVLDRTGRHGEAIQAFQTAMTRPDWKGGSGLHWFGMARSRARNGDLSGARDCYERGLRSRFEPWPDLFLRDEAASLFDRDDPTAE
jgi:serine/threonine protein kinase